MTDEEIKMQYRFTHHALVELYKLCKTLGNFKNGVEHNGIDEGEVYASGIFDRVEAVLRNPSDDGWRKIETAPNDHFVVLVYGPHGALTAFRDVNWNWWQFPASDALNYIPTHWMPLPERPATTLADALKAEEQALHRCVVHHTAPKGPLSLDEAISLSKRMGPAVSNGDRQ